MCVYTKEKQNRPCRWVRSVKGAWGASAACEVVHREKEGILVEGALQLNVCVHRRFIYEADTSTHAHGTDPRVAWGA